MIDVIDLIPSKDLRQALRESGREFTDIEKATEEAEGDEAELRQMATWTAQGDCGLELISTVLKKHILKNAQ